MQINRRNFITGCAALGALSPIFSRLAQAGRGAPRKLVVVLARGAWDVTYLFDPRPAGDPNVDGPWRAQQGGAIDYVNEDIANIGQLQIAYNDTLRPNVTSFFQNWSDLSLVVNGISTGTIVHDLARPRILTGSRRDGASDLAAIFGSTHQAGAPIGYMDFAGQGFPGNLGASSAKVGSRGQLEILLNDELESLPGPVGASWTYPQFLPSSDDQDAIQQWLSERESRFRDQHDNGGLSSDRLTEYASSRVAAAELRAAGEELSELIVLGETLDILAQVDLAVALLNDDLCSAVLLDTGMAWDTHTNNTAQNDHFNDLFAGLNLLANKIGRGALEQEVLVVVLSEFTRTPKLNATNGKDHWPVASTFMFGAGVDGGRTIGKTSDTLGAEPINLSTGAYDADGVVPDYSNLIAGILSASGVDLETHMPGVAPYTAISGG